MKVYRDNYPAIFFLERMRAFDSTLAHIARDLVRGAGERGKPNEQRLREYITDLYGGVIFYDGPPSATEVQNADALARELVDVTKEFDTWMSQALPGINAALTKKKLDQVQVMTRAQWDAANPTTR